ncbi:ribonuclease H protein [Tanacetum coccineum]
MAELYAIHSSCRLAVTYGWQNVVVESDSKVAISLACAQVDPPWSLSAIVVDNKVWASQSGISFSWAKRDSNLATHTVAKLVAHTVAKLAFRSHENFVWNDSFHDMSQGLFGDDGFGSGIIIGCFVADNFGFSSLSFTLSLNEPPLPEGYTSRSGEGRMEHTFELMDNVPPTPYDSPLLGGYTPASDEGRLKLEELMAMYTKLSKQVLDLEKEKYAQAVEILKLKKRVKKLERTRKSSISHTRQRIYRQVKSSDDDDLDEKDASK